MRILAALSERARQDPRSLALLVRFLGAGLLNTAFSYTAFVLLLATGLHPSLALVGSTVAGVLFNFQTSRRLVFRTRQTGMLLKFAVLYGALLVVNWAALTVLRAEGLNAAVAQAIIVLPAALLAFLCQRTFIFRPDREPS